MKDFIPIGDLYLDTDSDPKVNKGSDYILNTIFTSDGRRGVAINCKGMELAYFYSDGHTWTFLDWCADYPRNRVIMFFACDETGEGRISYYDVVNYYYGNIAKGTYLLLSSLYPKCNPQILGDLLFWTDGNSQPCSINYIKAYNYTNNIFTTYKYNTLNSDIIKHYKKPGLKPSVGLSYGSSNLIRGKSFQWAYRYVYSDGYKSVLSPYTNIHFSDTYAYPNGEFRKDYGINQFILSFNYFFEDVIATELFVRLNDKSDWYLYDVINRPLQIQFTGVVDEPTYTRLYIASGEVTDNDWDIYNNISIGSQITGSSILDTTAIIISKGDGDGLYPYIDLDTEFDGSGWKTVSFTNLMSYRYDDTKLKIAIDQKELTKQFHYIPLKASNQEIIEKNRLIYAGITEGFDPVKINASWDLLYNNTSIDADNNATYIISAYVSGGITYWLLRFNSYPTLSLYGVQLLVVNPSTGVYNYVDVRYVSRSTDNSTSIIDKLAAELTAKGIAAIGYTYGSPSYYWIRLNYSQPSAQVNSAVMFSYSLKNIYRIPKFGSNYLGGITYYDKELRHSSVNKFETPISIPKYYNFGYASINYYAYMQLQIKNLPPTWAHYYSVDISPRIDIDQYWMLYSVYYMDYYYGTTDGYLRVKVNNIINYAHDNNGTFNMSSYTFNEGDRLRVIGYATGFAKKPIPYTVDIDVQILRMEWPSNDSQYQKDQATTPAYMTDANGNKIKSDLTSYIVIPITTADIPNSQYLYDILFEIYRPKKTSDNPAYFPSIMLSVGNPGSASCYHMGTTQHQNPNLPTSTPAILQVYFGDTYLKLRDCRYVYPATDDNFSDYYTSNYWNTGRPNFFDENAKQSNLTTGIRFSGRLLENTKINQLNVFDYDDLITLKSEFGSINFIKEVGDVLKVLQEKKETSVYVEREEIQNADDSHIIRTSTKVLGTVRRMLELRGCKHPNSVVIHNRNMYYWDNQRKEVIRSSPNGQIAISEYGMKTWFKAITGYTDVTAGYDENYNIYFITFVGTGYTLAFYEGETPRWRGFFSFTPKRYLSLGTWFASPDSRAYIYKHNSNSVQRNRFYGYQYNQQINFYSNKDSAIKKLFRWIRLKTNKAWSVPIISIEADASYPRGIVSKLNTNHFELKEGEYSAEYLNNMKTTSDTESNLDLINGDPLRGFYIKHEIQNSENAEVWILGAEIEYEPSNNY